MQLQGPLLLTVAGIFVAIHTVLAAPPHAHDIAYFRQHLGSRTPYTAYPKPAKDTITDKYNVEQFQMISRHGTRYPSVGDAQEIARVIDILKTSNSVAVDWLATYDNVYLTRRGKELDINGMREFYDYGHRVSHSYSDLVNQIVDIDVFLYYSSLASWSKRTAQSAIAFQTGLFEGMKSLLNLPLLSDTTPLVAPLQTLFLENGTSVGQADNCDNWITGVKNNPATTVEPENYMNQVVGRIASRLSQEIGITLEPVDVVAIYTGCTFDITHRNRVDTFCTLLAPEDIPILEYYRDLGKYYESSYGSELNTKLACPLMQSVMTNMEDVVNGRKDYTRMDIKLLHSDSVLLTETFLELFKDDQHLRADWSQQQINNRKFRTSEMSGFGSNIVFQLLSDRSSPTAKFVRVLISEHPVTIPKCGFELCPFETFKSIYQEKLYCSFAQLCS